MVRIRLRRTGARNQPAYRIVAADKEKPRDGRFLEILGHYNPRTEPATIEVDEARLFHWLKNGAQPSESVRQIMQVSGAWDRWNRYRDGEELEALLEEAAAAMQEVDPRTRRDDLVSKKVSKKAKKAAEEVAAEAKEGAEEEPQAALEEEAEKEEPDEQVEDEASAAPEAEAEESESEDAEKDAEAEGEQGAEQSEEAQEEEETEAEASDEEEETEAEASDEQEEAEDEASDEEEKEAKGD